MAQQGTLKKHVVLISRLHQRALHLLTESESFPKLQSQINASHGSRIIDSATILVCYLVFSLSATAWFGLALLRAGDLLVSLSSPSSPPK
jgi:hypothetical protein